MCPGWSSPPADEAGEAETQNVIMFFFTFILFTVKFFCFCFPERFSEAHVEAGERDHQALVAAGDHPQMYFPRPASGEVSRTGRPMQKPQMQPGASGVREGSVTYIVRSPRWLGFETPSRLCWCNAPLLTQTLFDPVQKAHHHRQIAAPVSIAEGSTCVVRCPHPGTQIMNETFNISAMHVSYPAPVSRAPNKTGEDNVGVLQAEAFNSPTPQCKGTLSPTKSTTSATEVEHVFFSCVNNQLQSVDPPIDAVGDDSDSDEGINGDFE